MVLANACGPCIGQWARFGAEKKEKIQSSLLLIEILLNEMMVIPIPMLL